ncbi:MULTISPECIES: PIN domain-containing protein [unclassified Archaeoglobus]|uniref:PIN domain-containing protein n=1 Tax=unclassified Archaeoglobus TaxID=2643606 RepID=UPI0025C23840|nr:MULTISPECIES: PIN domain-containing protein [unclassified Archaeoglobus]
MHAVVDTNVLIYDTFEDTQFHKESRKLLDSLGKWLVPTVVLMEYAWFFRKNMLTSMNARDMLEDYLSDPRFRCLEDTHKTIKQALEFICNNNLSLSHFNDVIILSHAISRKRPLATFDRSLRKIAVKQGIEVLPEESEENLWI